MEVKKRAAKLTRWTTKRLKIEPEWIQKPSPGGVPHRVWGAPRWGTPGVPREKIRKKIQLNKKEVSIPGRPPLLSEKVANMAPSWAPSWSQNVLKIHPKINQKIDASWNRFLEGFCWIWDGKMEASWHPNRTKSRYWFESGKIN